MNHPNDSKSIAQCVVDEIIRGEMFSIHLDGWLREDCVVTWKANAVEQLEALISEEIARRATNVLNNPEKADQ